MVVLYCPRSTIPSTSETSPRRLRCSVAVDTMPSSQDRPLAVLFVCLGNICRSPMAEGVFRNLTNNLPSSTAAPDARFSTIDSAGTGAYHALSPPDSRTVAVLKKHGIRDYNHAARKVRSQDFTDYDWIFAMDEANYHDLLDSRRRLLRSKPSLAENDLGQVVMFGRFGGKSKDEEVIDPYYGGRDGFDTCYEQMVRFSNGFLAHLDSNSTTR